MRKVRNTAGLSKSSIRVCSTVLQKAPATLLVSVWLVKVKYLLDFWNLSSELKRRHVLIHTDLMMMMMMLIMMMMIIIIIIIIIDVAIPADRNVVQKEAEKKLKYKSLCIEIQRIWNLKCTIIPVIIGATGIVTRSFRKNLEAVPGKHSIDSLQKTAVLGTSHIIRKVLQCEA